MKKLTLIFAIGLFLFLVACTMPNFTQPTASSPDAAFTQAAQTIAAKLTEIAQSPSSTPVFVTEPPQPTHTFTLPPTNTLIPSPTNTTIPCLMVGFNTATIDQTVPDNTIMAPGQSFVKTWRLINMGNCTWTSSYQLVFDHGDGMGIPVNYAQTLTSGNVGYGQAVNISVSLVAPATPGTYTGYWRFRDPNGNYFGIGGTSAWIVKIRVINSTTVSLTPVPALSGSIRSDGTIASMFKVGEADVDNSKLWDLFLDYDISGLPNNATIVEVKFDVHDYTLTGNPFNLGVLNGYLVDYGASLDPTDYVPGPLPGNIVDWGSASVLNNIEIQATMKTALISKLGTGRFQIRLLFPGVTNDGMTDNIVFAHPTLIIKYIVP